MTNDLFQNSNSAQNSTVASSAASRSVTTNTSFNFDFGTVNIDSIIQQINLYALIWSAFTSFVLISNFYFYYRRHSDRELSREADGKKSIWLAVWVWFRYLFVWIALFVFTFLSDTARFAVGLVVILGFVVKFWFDMRALLIAADYFDWYKPMAKNLLRLFEFYKPPKPSKK
jgi:hypothetical protein